MIEISVDHINKRFLFLKPFFKVKLLKILIIGIFFCRIPSKNR